MCKKQTSVSHGSTEAELVSLDAGMRMDGIPSLDLWDLVIDVLHSSSIRKQKLKQVRSILSSSETSEKEQCNTQNSQRHLELSNVDFVPSNVNSSHEGAMLYIFEDNEAVIKMIMKSRSPTMRRVSRTLRVALDWLFDRIDLDPKIRISYIWRRKNWISWRVVNSLLTNCSEMSFLGSYW